MLGVKSEATKFINKALSLSKEVSIKEEQLEKYTNRLITTNLFDKESDVIYKIKERNIFILIEHQTQIDYKMPIRMLEYSLGIIKSAIDYKRVSNKDYEMPSVIPIVQEGIKHKDEYNQQAEEVFVIMIKRILMKKIGSERAIDIIEKFKGVDEDMLTSLVTIEEENKFIFNNGIKTGIKTGIKQGKIEIIKNMLKEKISIDLIAKVTGTSKREINKIKSE